MRGVISSAFSSEEFDLLRRASAFVRAINEAQVLRSFPGVRHIRCHELARAVGKMLHLTVVDGFVIDHHEGVIEHSWLKTAAGNLLDVYVPNRYPLVQLIHQSRVQFVKDYQEGKLTTVPPFDKGLVAALVKMMLEEEHVLQRGEKCVYLAKGSEGRATMSMKKTSKKKGRRS